MPNQKDLKSSTKQDQREPSELNWTTARIWLATDAEGNQTTAENVVGRQLINLLVQETGLQKQHTAGNVGHASVETEKCYGSFWPKGRITGLKTPTASQNFTLDKDIKEEGKEPEVQVDLFTLDTQKIHEKYNELTNENRDYALKVKSNPNFRDNSRENCSTYAYQLLEAGGINQLSPVCRSMQTLLRALTPNDLASCIRDAKKQELEKYPQTASYSRPKI